MGPTANFEDKREEWRDFLLRACHDLRSPLRAVRTNSELLLRSAEKGETQDFGQMLSFLVNGAATADQLVQEIANYAVALQVNPSAMALSMRVLVNSAVAKLAPAIRESGAEITQSDLPRVTGDPDRLLQLMENLLRNAIRHRGERRPKIHISAGQQPGEWTFAVRDNGPGIEAEDLQRIFRPFERLTRETGGAGLGLAACRAIVAGHGGRIWAESTPGQGTTMYFTLPG